MPVEEVVVLAGEREPGEVEVVAVAGLARLGTEEGQVVEDVLAVLRVGQALKGWVDRTQSITEADQLRELGVAEAAEAVLVAGTVAAVEMVGWEGVVAEAVVPSRCLSVEMHTSMVR